MVKKNLKNISLTLKNVMILLWRSSALYFITMIIMSIISGLTLALGIIIWKNILDAVQESFLTGSVSKPIFWLISFCVLEILQKIFDEVSSYFKNILSSKANQYITKILLEKTEEITLTNYDNSSIYDKLQKANEESTGRTMELLLSMVMLFKGISVFVSTATILLNFNFIILLICIGTSVPALIINMLMTGKQYEIYNERFENMRFIEYIKNLLTKHENIKEIKVYGVTKYFSKYVEKSFENYINEDIKIRKKYSANTIFEQIIENCVIYGIKISICIEVVVKKVTIGNLTMYFSAIDNFRSSIANIIHVISSIFENGLYVNNFFELVNTKYETNGTISEIGEFQNIIFQDVWFRYPEEKNYTIKNLNMQIEKNKTYAIVGLNGTGKTTILKLLLRLYVPQKGNIYVNGYNINELEISNYYKYIASVFQDFIKYPLSIKENITLGNVDLNIDEKRIFEAAEKGGLLDFINHLPNKFETRLQKEWSNSSELSLGQWQRLAICRAWFKDAPIMLLDEPTASLDPVAEHDMCDKIENLMKNKTCIIIAHRFSTVRKADKIFVLNEGEISESGKHEELMKKNGLYSSLFNMQVKGYMGDSE